MFKFSDIVQIQEQSEFATEKNVSDGKEMTENINDRSEIEFASVEDPLNMHRNATYETTLVFEIPSIISDENVIIATGQGEKPVSVLSDEFCEKQTFAYLFAEGKFGYNAPRDIPLSPDRYFNKRLLNFNHYFASDVDYIISARSVQEQHHLHSSINFAMHKIKPRTLTAGIFKNNLKETIERFVASDNAFSFLSSVKGALAYWRQILYDEPAMVKQLGIPKYFLILSCADLRCKKHPYIINKLNNLDLSDEELKNLSCGTVYSVK